MNLGEFQRDVLGDEARNEARKRVRVPSIPQNAFSASLPISRPNPVPGMSINTRSLTSSRRVGIVHHLVGRGGQVRVACRHHVLRPQRAHVQPHRRAARPAVIEERNRPVLGLRVLLEVRHVEHPRHGRRILRLFRARPAPVGFPPAVFRPAPAARPGRRSSPP